MKFELNPCNALALFTNGRPVKLQFSREEEFMASVARAPAQIHLKTE